MRNNIPERAWDTIYSFLHKVKGLNIKNENDTRCFLEGVWYVLRTGCQWRLLPNFYGHWRKIHKRYKMWSDLMSTVSEIDDQAVMIDATIVRAQSAIVRIGMKPRHWGAVKVDLPLKSMRW